VLSSKPVAAMREQAGRAVGCGGGGTSAHEQSMCVTRVGGEGSKLLSAYIHRAPTACPVVDVLHPESETGR